MQENYANWQDYDFADLDGIIITGAPVELLEFENVDFCPEVCEIISKSLEYKSSVMLVCWAAQAGLNYLYGINKQCLENKLFDVYEHKPIKHDHPLLKGVDGELKACIYSTNQNYRSESIGVYRCYPSICNRWLRLFS
ncbi:homoserine O-acetyltransferase/O-succinyltransferase family protein [Francisella noatunensis]